MSNSGLEIWTSDGATLLFTLDISTFKVSEQKSVDVMEIPGNIWNTAFDAVSVNIVWTFSGVFYASDATWDATNFTGRPLDFIHYLRSVLKSVHATDDGTGYGGSYISSPTDAYASFALVINTFMNGVKYSYNVNTAYTRPDGDATKYVRFIYQSGDIDFKAGEIFTVAYDLTFKETDNNIIRLA